MGLEYWTAWACIFTGSMGSSAKFLLFDKWLPLVPVNPAAISWNEMEFAQRDSVLFKEKGKISLSGSLPYVLHASIHGLRLIWKDWSNLRWFCAGQNVLVVSIEWAHVFIILPQIPWMSRGPLPVRVFGYHDVAGWGLLECPKAFVANL